MKGRDGEKTRENERGKVILVPGTGRHNALGPSLASHFCPGFSGNFSEFRLFGRVTEPDDENQQQSRGLVVAVGIGRVKAWRGPCTSNEQLQGVNHYGLARKRMRSVDTQSARKAAGQPLKSRTPYITSYLVLSKGPIC